MLSCLDFFALAIDMATCFLVGGPILKEAHVDFACDWLDFDQIVCREAGTVSG